MADINNTIFQKRQRMEFTFLNSNAILGLVPNTGLYPEY